MADQNGGVHPEKALYPPSEEFSSQASIASPAEYQQLWDAAASDPEAFWGERAKDTLHWFKPFDKVLEWE